MRECILSRLKNQNTLQTNRKKTRNLHNGEALKGNFKSKVKSSTNIWLNTKFPATLVLIIIFA